MRRSLPNDLEAFDVPREELASNGIRHLTYPKQSESENSGARVILTLAYYLERNVVFQPLVAGIKVAANPPMKVVYQQQPPLTQYSI